jgi:hypothetical protein
MFGFGKSNKEIRDKCADQITTHLRAQFGPVIRWGSLTSVIQTNPYVAGYFMGKKLALIKYLHHVEGLPQEMFNQVSGFVLLNLFGETNGVAVSNAIKHYNKTTPPDFLRGMQRGDQIVCYMAGIEDIRDDPEYLLAVRRQRESHAAAVPAYEMLVTNHGDELGWSDPDPSDPGTDAMTALMGLEQLWIGDLLKEIAM